MRWLDPTSGSPQGRATCSQNERCENESRGLVSWSLLRWCAQAVNTHRAGGAWTSGLTAHGGQLGPDVMGFLIAMQSAQAVAVLLHGKDHARIAGRKLSLEDLQSLFGGGLGLCRRSIFELR